MHNKLSTITKIIIGMGVWIWVTVFKLGELEWLNGLEWNGGIVQLL